MLTTVDQAVGAAAYARAGHFNDLDQLAMGKGSLTTAQGQSEFSIWAVLAAPLNIKVGVTTGLTPQLVSDAGNADVIAISQDQIGAQGKRIVNDANTSVFAKPLANGDYAVLLLNKSSSARPSPPPAWPWAARRPSSASPTCGPRPSPPAAAPSRPACRRPARCCTACIRARTPTAPGARPATPPRSATTTPPPPPASTAAAPATPPTRSPRQAWSPAAASRSTARPSPTGSAAAAASSTASSRAARPSRIPPSAAATSASSAPRTAATSPA